MHEQAETSGEERVAGGDGQRRGGSDTSRGPESKNGLALFLSDFLTPLVIIVYAVLCWEAQNALLLIAAATIFFAVLPEWIFAKTGTRKGSSGRQRLEMQSMFVASIIAGFAALFLLGAPKAALAYSTAFSIGQLIVLLFVPVWKISGHASKNPRSQWPIFLNKFAPPGRHAAWMETRSCCSTINWERTRNW